MYYSGVCNVGIAVLLSRWTVKLGDCSTCVCEHIHLGPCHTAPLLDQIAGLPITSQQDTTYLHSTICYLDLNETWRLIFSLL